MVKFTGEFVVEEIATGKKYLAETLFAWEPGDNLSYFTTGGTAPTIAANGNIDMSATAVGFSFSHLRYTLTGILGQFNVVYHLKLTTMNDNTSTAASYFAMMDGTITGGVGWYVVMNTGQLARFFTNVIGAGPWLAPGDANTIGTEYTMDLVKTPDYIYWLRNGIVLSALSTSVIPNAPPSMPPEQSWRAMTKGLSFFCQANGGELVHAQVRDIKIGRLKGVSW